MFSIANIARWRFDVWFAIPIVILILIGLVMLYSLGLGEESITKTSFFKQAVFVPVGFLLLLIVSFIDYRWYNHYARYLYLFSVILLGSVLIFGEKFRGTRGWFEIGNVVWQPVELVKIIWVIWLAHFFSTTDYRARPIYALLVSFLHLFITAGLTILQPDLGSALLFIGTWALVIVMLSFPWRYIISILLTFCVIAFFGWFFMLADFQQERIKTFLNPERDPLGSGYNVRQSIIAIGAGEFFGRGIAEGTQSQLRFLPESQTDFIFSVIGEELGFVGVIIVLAAWAVIFWRLYVIGRHARDSFSSLMILGFLIMLGSQVLVNIGMTLGLLPVTGLGLPFVSYGRSSLLSTFLLFGIIINIARSVRIGSLERSEILRM